MFLQKIFLNDFIVNVYTIGLGVQIRQIKHDFVVRYTCVQIRQIKHNFVVRYTCVQIRQIKHYFVTSKFIDIDLKIKFLTINQ
jgi:hypothetical protein